jgi:hypothetical protein
LSIAVSSPQVSNFIGGAGKVLFLTAFSISSFSLFSNALPEDEVVHGRSSIDFMGR